MLMQHVFLMKMMNDEMQIMNNLGIEIYLFKFVVAMQWLNAI